MSLILKKVKPLFNLLLFGGVLIFAMYEFMISSNKNFEESTSMKPKIIYVTRPSPSTSARSVAKELKECPQIPRNRTTRIIIDVDRLNSTDYPNITNLKPGGWYKPPHCKSRNRIAVIVPFRNRADHIRTFMRYMHQFLQKQQIDYRIFLVEQTQEGKFNKAVMMNTGFVEANKLYDYDCFIFHDIDLLPENEGIIYNCDKSPVHMCVANDGNNYKPPYKTLFGGCTSFTTEHFKQVNGFSNLYFNWGGEDDDMFERVKNSHLKMIRLPIEIARYKRLNHTKATHNPDKVRLYKTMKIRQQTDGLNSLRSHVVRQEFKHLYTWILVSINETDILDSEPIHKRAFKKAKSH